METELKPVRRHHRRLLALSPESWVLPAEFIANEDLCSSGGFGVEEVESPHRYICASLPKERQGRGFSTQRFNAARYRQLRAVPKQKLSLAMCHDSITTPRTAPLQNAKALLIRSLAFASKLGVVLLTKMLFNRTWPLLQVTTLCHSFVRLLGPKLPSPAEAATRPLQSVAVPVAGLTIAKPIFQWLFPDLYRTTRFWRRLFPIYTRYMITKLYARNKSPQDRHKIWAKRHEWGGKMVHQLVLDMSGFYVKSAQILASKADFVPDAWRKWLSKHLDDAPPRPFNQIRRSIQQQLAQCRAFRDQGIAKNGLVPLDAVFLNIEHEAIAAASIAQVHGAVLRDGRRVAAKVQHLGMDCRMQSDLRNLARVARFLKGQLPVDLTPIVKEIQATIPLEFDFEREVWFMTRIENCLRVHGFTSIVCPLPITDYCTQRLIVMQRLDGIPFTRILHPHATEDIQARIPEVKRIVRHLVDAYGQMLLVDGVFHADPHAGNLLLLPDGRLGLLDYGQSKVLGDTSRMQVAKMVLALSTEDDAAAAQVLFDMGILFKNNHGGEVPLQTLAMMARMLFDTCYVEEATVSPMAENSILRTVPMTSFNQELWLVVRTILILRGLFFSLKMDLSAAAIWKPYAQAALAASEM